MLIYALNERRKIMVVNNVFLVSELYEMKHRTMCGYAFKPPYSSAESYIEGTLQSPIVWPHFVIKFWRDYEFINICKIIKWHKEIYMQYIYAPPGNSYYLVDKIKEIYAAIKIVKNKRQLRILFKLALAIDIIPNRGLTIYPSEFIDNVYIFDRSVAISKIALNDCRYTNWIYSLIIGYKKLYDRNPRIYCQELIKILRDRYAAHPEIMATYMI
jgi:hypothetical protein